VGSDRYLAVSLKSEDELDRRAVIDAANREAQGLLGDAGAAALDIWVYDVTERGSVIGCRRGETGRVRAALACITEAGDVPVAPRVKGISGTIKKARALLKE